MHVTYFVRSITVREPQICDTAKITVNYISALYASVCYEIISMGIHVHISLFFGFSINLWLYYIHLFYPFVSYW